jgi:hypothetical protein
MNRLRTVAAIAALALLVLSGAACKQGLNDRCELDSDCSSGLKCSTGNNTTKADSGKCVSINAPAGNDASVVDTGGGSDDATSTPDTALESLPTDSSSADVQDDTATGDAVTGSDTAPAADASTDAAAVD